MSQLSDSEWQLVEKFEHDSANMFKLTNDLIDVQQTIDLVSSDSCGAIATFLGTTRDNFDGQTVLRLEYECYTAHAVVEMRRIFAELRSRWPDIHRAAVIHRLGCVPVRQASVLVAISSAHRRASLEGVQFCIDQIKARLPMWKKEIVVDAAGGEPVGHWKANAECAWSRSKPLLQTDLHSTQPPGQPLANIP